MKFKVLRGVCIGPGRDVHTGDEIELSEAEARYFVLRGRLAPIDGGTVEDPTKGGFVTTMETTINQGPKTRGGKKGKG